MNIKFTPITILSASAVIGLFATLAFILIALQRPWMGLTLSVENHAEITVLNSRGPSAAIPPGTILVNIESEHDKIDLLPIDLTIEPDGTLHTYVIYKNFLERQGRIATIMKTKAVSLTTKDGLLFNITPYDSRPFSTLPAEFWVSLIVGLFAWLISSAVFAFRSSESSAWYLLLSGLSTLIFAPFGAIYATRELAMPETLFMYLSDGNFLGGSLFLASFIGLLLYYPKTIAPKWVGLAVVATFIIWFIMQQVGVFLSMTVARRTLVIIGLFSTFALAPIHWVKTKTDPVARASLQWFLLSWMFGSTVFCFFILLPQVFGVNTAPLQSYAYSLFILVYGGLAFGILRYKLFTLGEWWGRIVLWALTVLMLVIFDLVFLFALQFSSGLSISLALLFSGLFWIPIRSYVWNHFLTFQTITREEQFKQVVDIALTPPGQDIEARWRKLLKNIFDPLYLRDCKDVTICSTDNDGQILFIPSIGGISALSLEFAYGGKKLFATADVTLAEELVALLRHIIDNRSEYAKGVSEERHRIARDMHDNIGAQLMSALHNTNPKRKDTLIRETLTDLRDIVNDATRRNLSFAENLADLRVETVERLSSAGIGHNWLVKDERKAEVPQQVIHTLRSIIRETISNIIKHSKAKRVTIKISHTDETITLMVEDDGIGITPADEHAGNGLANIKARVTSANGTLVFLNEKNGLQILAEFPVQYEAAIS